MNLDTRIARSHFVARFFVWYVAQERLADGNVRGPIANGYSNLMLNYGEYEPSCTCDWQMVMRIVDLLLPRIHHLAAPRFMVTCSEVVQWLRYLSPIEQQMTFQFLENYYV